MLRIVSFNVNGLRAICNNSSQTIDQFLNSLNADIVCIQETKINNVSSLPQTMANPHEWIGYFAFSHAQDSTRSVGYSGVVTFCRKETATPSWAIPVAYEIGFTRSRKLCSISDHEDARYQRVGTCSIDEEIDEEGRCVITDHGQFVLVNIYFPNNTGPERDLYRERFAHLLEWRIRDLVGLNDETSGSIPRRVIIAGDWNVLWHPRDHFEYSSVWLDLDQQLPDLAVRLSTLISELESGFDADAACNADDDAGFDIDTDDDDGEAHSTVKRKRTELSVKLQSYWDLMVQFYQHHPLRRWLYQLIHPEIGSSLQLVDLYRHFYPSELRKYTCWNTKLNCRSTNSGTRLDTFMLALSTEKESAVDQVFVDCWIDNAVVGSDHCPVYLSLDLPVKSTTSDAALPHNTMAFHQQRRITDFFNSRSIRSVSVVSQSANQKFSSSNAIDKVTDQETLDDDDGNMQMMQRTISGEEVTRPKCRGHHEPCRLARVNKISSRNRGRFFWCCARGSAGSSKNSQAQCNHFQWQ